LGIFNVEIIDLINNLSEKFRGFVKKEKSKPYLKQEKEDSKLKEYDISDLGEDNFNYKSQVKFQK